MQTDITALGKEETENTPARGAAQTAEEHMEKCFNVHKTNDAGKSEGEKDERTAAKKEICDTVREHKQEKSAAERRRVGKLSVGDMFSVGNVVKAFRAVRKGTVPGRDGFPTEFYSKDPATVERLAEHLAKHFRETADARIMSEAMRCAIVSILYKGIKGKDKTTPDSYRPIPYQSHRHNTE